MRTAIRKRFKDFAAILVLFVIALGVGSFILANQRLTLPGWVPGIGKSFYKVRAEFTTAQAVTPGQGQTVDIAGVKVGEISKVDLKDGHAIVTMNVQKKYSPIYRDATMLLRPKTGLKDMIVEMDPGNATAGKLPSGGLVPVQNTLPDVNLDEFLAALDADTRDYLKLLLGDGARGISGQEAALSATIRRFSPTSRDLLAINGMIADRRVNLRRLIHNFSSLSDELGNRDDQLARFVGSSNQVFQAFAAKDAALKETIKELPTALLATRTGLSKADRLARQLGPTLDKLNPTARALGPALRQVRPFLRQTTPVIQNELRPFARAARPVTANLRPAAANLAAIAPDLTSATKVVNYALNTLAYQPGHGEEGYLYYLAWANHLATTVFGAQDANGVIRRGLLLASCSTLGLLDQVGAANDALKTLVGLVRLPLTSKVCSSQAGAGSLGTP